MNKYNTIAETITLSSVSMAMMLSVMIFFILVPIGIAYLEGSLK